MQPKWLIGIDEAGRGPLAGPVSVGVVLVPSNFDWNLIPGVNDSKKLSEKKREVIFLHALELVTQGKLVYSVQLQGAKNIDRQGIARTIRSAITQGLHVVMNTPGVSVGVKTVLIKLDGSLYAPPEFIYQETIIKGDAKEKVIGLASIMAKVTRDRYMQKISQKPIYAVYGFARHKGYGTLVHRSAIALHGLSPEHRTSYCRNIILV